MDEKRKQRLLEKGWSKEEVEHASTIIMNPEDRHIHIRKGLHMTAFWFLIGGVIFLNLLVVLFLIPILLFVRSPWVYGVVALLGLVCGGIFNWLILEIKHLEHKHHLLAMLLVPLMSLLNIAIIYMLLEVIDDHILISYTPDPLIFFFSLCFIIPYFVWFTLGKHMPYSD